jgi:leader peptidase (prepilin peptidase)/N-methyltransferase
VISYFPLIPLAYFGIRLSAIDIKTHRLPNQLVGGFALIEMVALGILSWFASDFARLSNALVIATITTTAYLLLYLLSRGSLGMGDVKFAFPLGLCVGWYAADLWLTNIFVAFLLAGLVTGIRVVTGRINRKSRIAFGPFMLASAVLTLALG